MFLGTNTFLFREHARSRQEARIFDTSHRKQKELPNHRVPVQKHREDRSWGHTQPGQGHNQPGSVLTRGTSPGRESPGQPSKPTLTRVTVTAAGEGHPAGGRDPTEREQTQGRGGEGGLPDGGAEGGGAVPPQAPTLLLLS